MSTEERAERLRVILAIRQGAPILSTEECGRAFAGSEHDLSVIDTVEADDCLLATACLEIEADLQQRRWSALERLGHLMPGCDGLQVQVTRESGSNAKTDGDPLAALSPQDARAALCALYELGWLRVERR
jgi:hypothetical protein